MTAHFITFEGLDGSGKSTHLGRAVEWMEAQGLSVVTTREPGGTRIGTAIRQVFLDMERKEMDPGVELLLMFADRRQHLTEIIDPALDAGRWVISDRFSDSTRAYQGGGRGISSQLIDAVDELATGHRRPFRTLLFDLPADQARNRGASSQRRQEGAVDRLDAEALAFYERVRERFLELAKGEPQRFRVIDSSGTIENTWRQTQAALEGILREAAALG
ncbi:MAG: dTMP kinase [Acidobacteriota bacterium]